MRASVDAGTGLVVAIASGLVIGVLGLVALEFRIESEALEAGLLSQARAHFKTIVATRAWNAAYGGVYVEKRAGVVSNPYLSDPDVTLTDGRVFTLRNPAMMTRELSERTNREGDYRTHITSLKLRNPANAPDAWERDALYRFEKGTAEIFERTTVRGAALFRYMAPLFVEEPCLKCHADQGYRVGDVRGGISVSIPADALLAAFHKRVLTNGALVILLLGAMGGLTLAGVRRVRHARDAADAARRRFEALLQGTEGVVWEADPADLRFTFVSQRAERLLGYAPDRWLAPGFWRERLHPDDRERVLAARRDGVYRAVAHELDYRCVRVDGMTVWVHDLATVVPRPDAPPRVHGVMIDITARKHAELAAAAERSEQDALLNNALIGIVYLRERRIVRCNRRLAEMFGYTPADLLGQSTVMLYPSRARFESIGAEAYATVGRGEAYTIDTQLKRRDGSLFWGAITGRAVDPQHPQAGSVWLYADISERKAAEASATTLLRAVEASPVSIVITDRDGGIEYVNPRFTQVSGYPADEVIGRNPRLLQSGKTPVSTYAELWQTLLAGKEWRGVLQNRRKNGELFWEEAAMVPIADDDGTISHFLAIKEDISDRIAIERELDRHRNHLEAEVRERTRDLALAVEKATAADRAKTEFLTNMSHEIRTPLNAVIGFSRLAMRADPTPRLADYLGKIDASGQILLELVNNLLDLAKIAAGRLEIDRTPFDLAALLARVASIFSFRAAEKQVRFDLDIPAQLPSHLIGDSLRINQVLLNLVGNAIKFTEHGEVVLGVAVRDDVEADFPLIEFSVRDTGPGMSAEELARAFEAFGQADASITRRYGGTGLGLAIARQLVALMGGELTASSAKGEGSTFRFALVLERDRERTEAPRALTARDPASMRLRFDQVRVLVAEDQPLNRQVAEELLRAVGVTVDLVENGQQAIDRLAAVAPGHYDLVLMDLQMPVLDGLSAMQAIRAEPLWQSLPIIAMTAHVLEEERRRAHVAGASDHLGKPFDPADLYALIATWVAPEKVIREGLAAAGAAPAAVPSTAVAVDGIDRAAGLAHFGGNAASYATWLQRFGAAHIDWSTRLAAAFEAADWPAVRASAHALKGSAGTLGLVAVQQAAAALETAAREGDAAPIAAALAQLETALARLDPASDTPTASPAAADAAPAVVADALRPMLVALLDKLRIGTGDSADLAENAHARAAGTVLEAPLAEIVAAVREFDFDRAEAALKTLLDRRRDDGPGGGAGQPEGRP